MCGAAGCGGGWAVRIDPHLRDGCARGILAGAGWTLMARGAPKAVTLMAAGSVIDRRPAMPMRTSVVRLDGFAEYDARWS